jgi:hypothetical protein
MCGQIWPGLDEPGRLSYSALPESVDALFTSAFAFTCCVAGVVCIEQCVGSCELCVGVWVLCRLVLFN